MSSRALAATRRAFLSGVGGAAVGWACDGALRRPLASPMAQALSATIKRVLVPDLRLVVSSSGALAEALHSFERKRTAPRLATAQDTWRQACLAWQRSVAFSEGPLVSTGALLRAAFWPVRRHAIAELVTQEEAREPEPTTALGVDQKGLFALEELLFAGPTHGATDVASAGWLSGDRSARAARLAAVLADDVLTHAQRAQLALGDGGAFATEFAGGGQLHVSRLVNRVLATVESAVLRMARTQRLHSERRLRRDAVQAGWSGLSTELLKVGLEVSARIYGHEREPSLAALTRAAAPAIHESVQRAFDAAALALNAVADPLERAVVTHAPQLTQALAALRRLELSVRTEWVSALGVTLTFTSSDGD